MNGGLRWRLRRGGGASCGEAAPCNRSSHLISRLFFETKFLRDRDAAPCNRSLHLIPRIFFETKFLQEVLASDSDTFFQTNFFSYQFKDKYFETVPCTSATGLRLGGFFQMLLLDIKDEDQTHLCFACFGYICSVTYWTTLAHRNTPLMDYTF